MRLHSLIVPHVDCCSETGRACKRCLCIVLLYHTSFSEQSIVAAAVVVVLRSSCSTSSFGYLSTRYAV
jgi:hypothetical protein